MYVAHLGSEHVWTAEGWTIYLADTVSLSPKKLQTYNSFFLDPIGSLVCIYNSQRLQSLPEAEPAWGPGSKYSAPLASLLSFMCL